MRDRFTAALSWLVGLLFLPWALGPAHTAERPNVVLVMADDMGWGDTGYNGNRIIKTPNLDRMSREGIRFDRFYAGSSVCSPTCGSCLTGRHPYRYGVHTANQGHLRGEEICLAMDRALPFLEDAVAAGKPFFAVIWFHAPYAPVVGGPPYRALYAEYEEDKQHFCAVVTALDEQVGWVNPTDFEKEPLD